MDEVEVRTKKMEIEVNQEKMEYINYAYNEDGIYKLCLQCRWNM